MKRNEVSVRLRSASGQKLAGVLHKANGDEQGALILSHCFTCSKDYKLMVWLSRALAQRGFTSLRFDFAGLGESQGEFAQTTLSTDIEDLLSAANWFSDQGHFLTAFIGHSMGGAVSILAADRLKELVGVVVIGTSPEVTRITRILNRENWAELKSEGVTTVSVQGRSFPFSRQFIEDLATHSLLDTVKEWDKSLLIIHGTRDDIVDIKEAEQLFAAASQPKTFIAVPGGDHLLGDRNLAAQLGCWIDLWLNLNRKTKG